MDDDKAKAIEAAQAAVDGWFGDMVTSLGPRMSTEAYNHFSSQREPLKERLANAISASE